MNDKTIDSRWSVARVRAYAPAAWEWLCSTRQPRLLQPGRQVCNLVNERREVLSVTTSAVGCGPFAIVVEGELTGISAESPLAVYPARPGLRLGNLMIDLATAPRWEARPAWANLRHCDAAAWPSFPWSLPGAHNAQASLRQSIIEGDIGRCRAAVANLAGRGPGLTPAGDDYLIGALYALWVWRPASPLLQIVAQTALPRTTTLSAAFLRAAAHGEATWHWHALIQGAPSAPALIAHVGDSSGRAMWAGFIDLFQGLAICDRRSIITCLSIKKL